LPYAKLREQLAEAAYQAALNLEYAWDSIAARFDDLLPNWRSDDRRGVIALIVSMRAPATAKLTGMNRV
jgi:hypothetical protein